MLHNKFVACCYQEMFRYGYNSIYVDLNIFNIYREKYCGIAII